jgi:hypothetical protein
MTLEKRWILLLALLASASLGVAFASQARRRHHGALRDHRQHKENLHTWENEGGNFAPAAAVSAPAGLA